MDLKDGASVVADLTTIGRKSGLPRTVELRFTHHRGNFYASSSRVKGKHWCENLLNNPAVVITLKDEKLACVARQLTDDKLRKEILAARGSSRDMDRVVFEMKPGGFAGPSPNK
jgi:deazaflavin-dependent oxidoreductase (nitroreductase family)